MARLARTAVLAMAGMVGAWLVPGLLAGQGQPPAAAVQVVVPDADQVQELELLDGSILYGRVESTGDPFRFRLLAGQVLEVRVADVRRLRVTRGQAVGGAFWPADPNGTRLFFGPTGRTLEAGEGYLSVFEIVFPVVAVGVTDRVTVAGGTPLFFGDLGSRPFWLAPKVGLIQDDGLALSAGVLAFFTTDSSESVGIVYLAGTAGDQDSAVHLGVGYGYDRGSLAPRPAIMLGGEHRLSRNLKLLTENYLFTSEGGVASGGIRFFGERLAVDLGLAVPLGWSGSTVAIPLVSFNWNW